MDDAVNSITSVNTMLAGVLGTGRINDTIRVLVVVILNGLGILFGFRSNDKRHYLSLQ